MPTVEVLRWPAEAHRRDPDRAPACLWLLPAGEVPPLLGAAEDWIRVPADERDLSARLGRLAGRSVGGKLASGEVVVEVDGTARRGGQMVALPTVEAAILAALAADPERLITRAALCDAVWGGAPRSTRALDSRVHTLRGRIGALGLHIHTVRGRGFLLSLEPPS